MASSLLESTTPLNPNALIGTNYQLTLTQLIQNLLADFNSETPNFSHFIDLFHQLTQAMIDPPLESIWMFSALSFQTHKSTNEDISTRVTLTKDLFQLISASSCSCSSSKSIALLAPVVFEVYKLACELLGKDLSSKTERKTMKETKSLIEVLIGYIGLCCSKNSDDESTSIDSSLVVPFSDIVSVWVGENKGLESFLPLVGSTICRKMNEGDFDVHYLAGAVMVEVFLLKLCLDFQSGASGAQLRNAAVGSITGLRNIHFFDILVNMLLEPMLPLTSLLISKDEAVLRNVVYDAVLLVDYSFLKPERVSSLSTKQLKNLALTRLIVTQEAIELFRKNGDQKRAVSCTSAFCSSTLCSQILKWICSNTEDKSTRTAGSSPTALIKSLLNLENQGIIIFEDAHLNSRAKTAVEKYSSDFEHPSSKVGKIADSDLFYIDDKAEIEDKDIEDKAGTEDKDEDDESMSAAFVTAAQSMKSGKGKGKGKKRKERVGAGKRIKYVKYDLSASPETAEDSSIKHDGLSSESEIEDPKSD